MTRAFICALDGIVDTYEIPSYITMNCQSSSHALEHKTSEMSVTRYFIDPVSLRKNRKCKSLDSRVDELWNGDPFTSVTKAQLLADGQLSQTTITSPEHISPLVTRAHMSFSRLADQPEKRTGSLGQLITRTFILKTTSDLKPPRAQTSRRT